MSVLDNAIAHAKDAPEISVHVPEWKTTLYYRGYMSMKDFSVAMKAINESDFTPLCKLMVKYAELENGEKAFPNQDDAYKLQKGADPAVIVRSFTPAMRPPESVEDVAKN